MKMPNGYGSVVKLSGKRRKPWAVRISYMDESPDGVIKRKQKCRNEYRVSTCHYGSCDVGRGKEEFQITHRTGHH